MKNSDKLKRYSMFIEGGIVSALGIRLITKAGGGTSHITSLAFGLRFLPKFFFFKQKTAYEM